MTTTKVKGVRPVIDQQTGQQRTWTNKEGVVNYIFEYMMENGMRGEVMHQQPQPRFPVGSEVVATDATKDQRFPKLKLEKPGGGGGFGGARKGNDPDYNARLQASGLVQAAISAGAKTTDEILGIARNGVAAAAKLKAEILAATHAVTSDPRASYVPAAPAAPAPNPFAQQGGVYGAQMGQHSVGQMPTAQQAISGNAVPQPVHSGEDLPW